MSEEKQILLKLKHEVEALKKNIADPSSKSRELVLEIESLKDSIHELNIIFQKALKETKEDDFSSALKVIKDNLGTLISQNETLARGIVALAEKFEGEEKSPRESQSFMGAPSFGNRVAAPKPNFSFSAPPAPPQPINLQKKKRTGLF